MSAHFCLGSWLVSSLQGVCKLLGMACAIKGFTLGWCLTYSNTPHLANVSDGQPMQYIPLYLIWADQINSIRANLNVLDYTWKIHELNDCQVIETREIL